MCLYRDRSRGTMKEQTKSRDESWPFLPALHYRVLLSRKGIGRTTDMVRARGLRAAGNRKETGRQLPLRGRTATVADITVLHFLFSGTVLWDDSRTRWRGGRTVRKEHAEGATSALFRG